MCAGFAAGMISSGGDLNIGIIGALTADAFQGIGSYFEQLRPVMGITYRGGEAFVQRDSLTFTQSVVKVAAHGVVGGLSS